jgi:D-aminoacyl-tRNA deacylase
LILFIASTQDTAGMNIANQLIANHNFKKTEETFQNSPIYTKTLHNKQTKLIFVNTEIVNTQFLENHFSPDIFIFLSRHSSKQGIPTLSVHTPGNLSEAKFGGKPNTVSVSPAAAMKNALKEMEKLATQQNLDYEVSYECTHHGPSLDTPAMFVELGSSPEQWKDIKAAEVVAEAAVAALKEFSEAPVALGIGGPHYNKKFTKLALGDEWAFGHMIPKYALNEIGVEMLRHCVERTFEPVDSVVLDWKGIKGEHKSRIVSAVDELGLSLEKV